RAVLRVSLSCMAVLVALLAGLQAAAVVFVVMIALGFSQGYASVVPGSVTADLTAPNVRGSAVGILRTTTDFGLFIGPMAAGALADHLGLRRAFLVVAVVVVA